MLFRDYQLIVHSRTWKKDYSCVYDHQTIQYEYNAIKTSYPGKILKVNNEIRFAEKFEPYSKSKSSQTKSSNDKTQVLFEILPAETMGKLSVL